MRRRTAISAVHTMPVTMPATATCQTRNRPDSASPQRTAELPAKTASCVKSIRLRLSASPTNPAIAPINSIGSVRATVTTATRKAECVAS